MIDIIHDCDPGNDDALGILAALGHPRLNLLAVTTGAGHLSGTARPSTEQSLLPPRIQRSFRSVPARWGHWSASD